MNKKSYTKRDLNPFGIALFCLLSFFAILKPFVSLTLGLWEP